MTTTVRKPSANPTPRQQQMELERAALEAGIEAYRRHKDERLADIRPGQDLLRDGFGPMVERIKDHREAALFSGKGGSHVYMWKYLQQFDDDFLAFLTLRVVIQGMGIQEGVTAASARLGKLLEDSMQWEQIKQENPKVYQRLQKKLEKTTHEGHRHVVMRAMQGKHQIAKITWDKKDTLKSGALLIALCKEATGWIEYEEEHLLGGKVQYTLSPAPEMLEWLHKSHAYCEVLRPLHPPCIIKPLDWSTPYNGGYHSDPLKYPMVKNVNKNFLHELKQVDMPMVYEAINALQSTPWKINKKLFNVMQTLWDEGSMIANILHHSDEPVPPRPADYETNQESRNQWNADSREVHERNARGKSAKTLMYTRMLTCKDFLQRDRLYLCWALDKRGRMYPVVSGINPQGDDTTRNLLLFADSLPIGENGPYWLAVHGANTFGIDRCEYQERVDWVQENHRAICLAGTDPLGAGDFWLTSENPWASLAFCIEWANLDNWEAAGLPPAAFESDLPIFADGSNNGLQHLSMARRMREDGSKVNLVPSERPNDIYTDVVRATQARIDREARLNIDEILATGSDKQDPERAEQIVQNIKDQLAAARKRKPKKGEVPLKAYTFEGLLRKRLEAAQKWAGKVNRKIAKQPTMTKSYSATTFGRTQQIKDAFRKLIAEDLKKGTDSRALYDWTSANYMATQVTNGIDDVVKSASETMDWLKEIAAVAASNGLPVHWKTPSGLLVHQNYRETDSKQLDFEIAGQQVRFRMAFDSDRLDKNAQKLGISPNLIHSWDAAHLARTVSYALKEGVKGFAMIHDSYGCHVGNFEKLAECNRRAFADQYSEDILADFRQQIVEQLEKTAPELIEKLPPPLPLGDLDPEEVKRSPYFFH